MPSITADITRHSKFLQCHRDTHIITHPFVPETLSIREMHLWYTSWGANPSPQVWQASALATGPSRINKLSLAVKVVTYCEYWMLGLLSRTSFLHDLVSTKRNHDVTSWPKQGLELNVLRTNDYVFTEPQLIISSNCYHSLWYNSNNVITLIVYI